MSYILIFHDFPTSRAMSDHGCNRPRQVERLAYLEEGLDMLICRFHDIGGQMATC